METVSPEQSAPKRRKFQIQSEFGRSRQWRSRKSRPCDTCRRRKTACIIDTRPPCRFCRNKGLDCRATADTARRSPKPSDENHGTVVETHGLDNLDKGVSTLAQILVITDSPGDPTGAPSPPWTINNDDALIVSSIATSPEGIAASLSPKSPTYGHTSRLSVHTLEDGVNLTAHSMGLSGEQDTELLASFRSVVMNEVNRVDADIIQVCSGDITGNRPPIHFSMLHDEFAPLDNVAKQNASNSIEAAVEGHADALVRLYFRHVHPVYPVLSKTRFLRAYSQDKCTIPASLRGTVYGLATNFWAYDANVSQTLHFNQHELFEAALTSLQREFHGPNLWTLQACLLLLHENPAENATIETPRVWTLASQAVACAQMIGLHRDPKEWSIAPWEKSLRRKLWWATFAVDVWSSVCHGNPPHIYYESFTTSSLTMEDMAFDETVPMELRYLINESDSLLDVSASARFFEGIQITRILHRLLLSSYLDVTYEKSMKDSKLKETSLLGLKSDLQNWEFLLPRCTMMDKAPSADARLNNAPVHLSFYTTMALLFRALMSPVTKAAKRNTDSCLRRHFIDAVKDFRPFISFMDEISPEGLHAFWGLHARSQLILCGNFLIYLFLLAPDPEQVQETFRLLGRFHDSLQRLSAVADNVAINLLRPVALRIDSFFAQAAQVMRTGSPTVSIPSTVG